MAIIAPILWVAFFVAMAYQLGGPVVGTVALLGAVGLCVYAWTSAPKPEKPSDRKPLPKAKPGELTPIPEDMSTAEIIARRQEEYRQEHGIHRD